MSSEGAVTVTEHADQKRRLPKLRFREFEQSGAWDFKPLRTLAKRRSERNAGEQIVRVLTNSAEYGVVDQRDYFDKDIATKGNLETYFVVAEGDYVYNPRISRLAPVGPIGKNKIGTGVMSPLYTVFRFDRETNEFYEHYFRSTHWHRYLRTASNTGARHDRMAISNDAFIEMPVPAPDPVEQQKIAGFLSSLDALIAAEADRLAGLKRHKKGLLQQLFPAAGETTPRLRFPEFRGAREWDAVELSAIADIKLGKMLDKQRNTNGRLLPYLNNLSVRWNEVDTSNLPEMHFNDDEIDRFGLKSGDVLVCEGGEPGRAAVWDGRMPDVKFQKALHRVRFNVPYEPKLLVHYLERIAGTMQFEMLFTGGGIQHLTLETFSRLKVPLIDYTEQQRIVACVSAVEDLTATLAAKIETLENHQASLLQQVFPSEG